jgi:DNA invertase Pin-like site-specific DNA recombinase
VAVDHVYTDKASGKDVERPELAKALHYCRKGDTLVVHSLDRLARNAEDLLRIVRELTGRGVTVEFIKNHMTFTGGERDPMATLMLTMLAGFAAFERDLIRERQAEGIAIAKAKGTYKGRAKALTPAEAVEARRMAVEGHSKAAIGEHFGVSRQTVYAYLRDA